jgi:hypothetical protein
MERRQPSYSKRGCSLGRQRIFCCCSSVHFPAPLPSWHPRDA